MLLYLLLAFALGALFAVVLIYLLMRGLFS